MNINELKGGKGKQTGKKLQYKQNVAIGVAKKFHGYKSSDDTSQNVLTQCNKLFLSYAQWM